jgi:2-oxoglutarate-Fe(II)-dependent oxygenase superfamily protein
MRCRYAAGFGSMITGAETRHCPSRSLLGGRVIVLDEVLDKGDLDSVLAIVEGMHFEPIDVRSAAIWRRNFPLNPQRGDQIVTLEDHPWMTDDRGADGRATSRPDALPVEEIFAAGGIQVYPTHSPLDRIIDTAVATARRHGLFGSGAPLNPYAACFATVYQYGPGTRLAWHDDRDYLGAFAAYLTPDWSENEGGYLAVQHGPAHKTLGLARIVEPRCNRVVVFAPGVRHSVLSVAEDATRPRVSLSGFFLSRRQLRTTIAYRIGGYLRTDHRIAVRP